MDPNGTAGNDEFGLAGNLFKAAKLQRLVEMEKLLSLYEPTNPIIAANNHQQVEQFEVSTMPMNCHEMGGYYKYAIMEKKIDEMAKEMDEFRAENSILKEEINVMKGAMIQMMDGISAKKYAQFVMRNEAIGNAQMEIASMEIYNKWNERDSGRNLTISGNGFNVTQSGPELVNNCVRANMPIPKLNFTAEKPYIAFYFEVQILRKANVATGGGICIGFCGQQFPLEGNFLGGINSIGFWGKYGIDLDGWFTRNTGSVEGFFEVNDVVGIGLLHYPAINSLKIFSTYNGEFQSLIELPKKFANLQLYPATSLYWVGESIMANFGQQKWCFNPHQLIQ